MSRGRELLASLFPSGRAFAMHLGSQLSKLLAGFGAELDRVEERASVLREESDPRTTDELLSEWEKALALDSSGNFVDRARTAALVLSMRGSPTPEYFRTIARIIGYDITVSEYPAFEPPIPLTDEQKKFCFKIFAPDATILSLKVGMKVGNPLRVYGAESKTLKTMIAELKPAHTFAVLSYGD